MCVVVDPEIVEVTPNSSNERLVLLGHRPMPLATTVVVDGHYGSSQARLSGLPGHVPAPPPAASAPIRRKPQKVEAPRTFPSCLLQRWSPEINESGLFRVKAQAKSFQSFAQYSHHALCIFRVTGVPASACPLEIVCTRLSLRPESPGGVNGISQFTGPSSSCAPRPYTPPGVPSPRPLPGKLQGSLPTCRAQLWSGGFRTHWTTHRFSSRFRHLLPIGPASTGRFHE